MNIRSICTALAVVVAVAFSPKGASAQGVTAFKSGEETTGMTKQCYYKFGATKYTRTIQAVQLCPLSIQVSSTTPSSPDSARKSRPGITAFKTGEETTGMTKQCYYKFGATKYTRTIQAVQLCPLSIQVKSP